MSSEYLSELLFAKVFHDLSNPIGVISNSLEILGNPEDKEIVEEMLFSSTDELVSMLKLQRITFAENHDENLQNAIEEIIRFLGFKNIQITQFGSADVPIPGQANKVFTALLLNIPNILKKGSSAQLRVAATHNQTKCTITCPNEYVLNSASEHVRLMLQGGSALNHNTVYSIYINEITKKYGIPLNIGQNEQGLIIEISMPIQQFG